MTHGPLKFCWKFGPCFFFEVDPSKIKVIGVPSMYGFTSKLGVYRTSQGPQWLVNLTNPQK